MIRKKNLVVMALWGIVSAWGCVAGPRATVPVREPGPAASSAAGNGWRAARFQFAWPEGEDPALHLDALVAHQVVAPVLNAFSDRILLWRFHRRAVRDNTGHQFSFLFYAPGPTAEAVVRALRSDGRLARLKDSGLLAQDRYSDTDAFEQPRIADTSDPQWSAPMRQAWPHFIMGASRMWLALIEVYAGRTDGGRIPDAPKPMAAFYKKIEADLVRTWQDEGRHALLHHLNALFGYGPVVVYEKRYLQF